MGKVVKLGVFALLIYVAIKQVPPLVEQVSQMGEGLSRKGSSVSQGDCVPAAERASESFIDEMRNFQKPPFDLDEWDFAMERISEYTYDAEARCNCGRDSCVRATEALSELNALIADFDNSLRGGDIALNPARRQETIDRLLKRAREFDRQGN